MPQQTRPMSLLQHIACSLYADRFERRGEAPSYRYRDPDWTGADGVWDELERDVAAVIRAFINLNISTREIVAIKKLHPNHGWTIVVDDVRAFLAVRASELLGDDLQTAWAKLAIGRKKGPEFEPDECEVQAQMTGPGISR